MLLEKSLTPAWVSFHGAPQPARRPVLGVRPHRRRSLRRLRRGSSSTALGFVQGRPVPFHTDTERPVRSGGPNGRLPCTLHAPLQTPERPSLTRRDRCGESRGWGRGPAGEPSGAGIICVRKPISPMEFYTLLLHRWEAVPDGPRPGRRGSRLPPARTDRPALQTRGPSLRGRGSTPDRFGNTSGRRPPDSRHTATHDRVAPARTQCSRLNACLNVSAPPPVHGWGSAQRDRCPTALRPGAALPPDVFRDEQGIVLVRPRSFDAPVAPATSGLAPGARAARPPPTYVQRNSR